MNFKSLPELLDYFKNEETCIKYYEKLRWNGNIICPHCGSENPYRTNRGFKCSNGDCRKKFTVKVGTIFENSKISFRIWFAAIYLCTTSKKGISSLQLSTQLNVTQKTAWFVLHRVREMLKDKAPQMVGNTNKVESDETYIGGSEANRHKRKKLASSATGLANDGTRYNKKKMVLGIIERNGKVVLKHIPAAKEETILDLIKQHVPNGSHIITDEAIAYANLKKCYTHNTVNHSLKVYVDGDSHTNTIENFWSILKRGIYGIFHQVSEKHLERYLDEFAGRFNTRQNTPQGRIDNFLQQSESPLSYKRLIAKN